MRRRLHQSISLLILALAGCGSADEPTGVDTTGTGTTGSITEEHTGYRLEYVAADRTVAQSIVPMIDGGRRTAEQFFATTYASSFVVRVLPNRAALTARWRVAFNQPTLQTECWMVAGGWATELDILSPAVWSTDACGHDGRNASYVTNIVAHELVHVLHGQRNTAFTSLASTVPWIVEGMAAFASGQWAADYARAVRPALNGGFAPETFAALWAAQANYPLAGSVFAYIDQRYGADAVRRMLTVRSEAELLTSLSTDAPTLLREWRVWALAQP